MGFLVSDGQVVDADQPDVSLDQEPCAVAGEPDEVSREVVAGPKLGVRRLQEEALETVGRSRLSSELASIGPVRLVASTTCAGPTSTSSGSVSAPAPSGMK